MRDLPEIVWKVRKVVMIGQNDIRSRSRHYWYCFEPCYTGLMEALSEIIKCFKPSECKFIRSYYMDKNNSNWTKRLQLFDLIKNKIPRNNDHASQLIYNHPPDSTFSQLKERLKKDLLNFLLLFQTVQSPETVLVRIEVECRKLIIQSKLLLEKSLADEAIALLQKGLKLTEQYDFTELRISILDQLSKLYINDEIRHRVILRELRQAMQLQLNMLDLKENYLYGSMYTDLTTKEKQKTRITCSAIEFQDDMQVENQKSIQFTYWKYSCGMRYWENHGNIFRSYLNGMRRMQLVESNSILFGKDEIETTYLDLSRLLLGKHYEKSIRYLHKIIKHPDTSPGAVIHALDLLFILQYSRREYKAAENILERVITPENLSDSKFDKQKWFFYKACHKFVMEDYAESSALLKRCVGILKEKSGLFIEYKVLEILNIIAEKEFELLDYKIESFRKVIDYYGAENNERAWNIIRLIKVIMKGNLCIEESEWMVDEIVDKVKPENRNPEVVELIDAGTWLLNRFKISSKVLIS